MSRLNTISLCSCLVGMLCIVSYCIWPPKPDREFCVWSPATSRSPIYPPDRVTGSAVLISGSAGPTVIYLCGDGLPQEYRDLATKMSYDDEREP